MPRFRLRRPLPFWLLATAVSLMTALLVFALLDRVDAAAARWGDVRTVAVAARDIAAGDVIAGDDVRLEERPLAVLPSDAVEASPIGRRASASISAGEAVVASRLAPAGVGEVAALLPPGTRGLAVPVDRGAVGVAVGDVVDLLATFDPAVSGEGDPTFVVAASARVIAVTEDAVTVAVDRTDAAPLAFALANGVVTIALA